MDGACFVACTVARQGSFQGGEGMRAEVDVGNDLTEIRWSAEVDRDGSGRCRSFLPFLTNFFVNSLYRFSFYINTYKTREYRRSGRPF